MTARRAEAAKTLVGIYPDAVFTAPGAVQQIDAIDAWLATAGAPPTTFGGMFIDLEQANPNFNVIQQLEIAWQAGLTPVVNLLPNGPTRTAAAIAGGIADAGIAGWAAAYKTWVDRGDGRRAFLAPLPEANYRYSVPYTLDPTNFKRAFARIQDIFADAGVACSQARWVFAPNGFTESGDPEWEEYFPGADKVDAVGFSQFNQGHCYGSPWDVWLDPKTTPADRQLFGRYIPRMRAMAPGLPIFLMQTASTAQSPAKGRFDNDRKNQWFRNAYSYFADQGLAGVMYFNFDSPCDYKLFRSSAGFVGYRDALTDPRFGYSPPAVVFAKDFPPKRCPKVNLLSNAGFERGAESWQLTGVQASDLVCNAPGRPVAHGGSCAIRLRGGDRSPLREVVQGITPEVGVSGQSIRVDAWVSASAVPATGTARIVLELLAQSAVVKSYEMPIPTGTYAYTRIVKRFRSRREFDEVRVRLQYQATGGRVLLDDLSLTSP